VDSVFAAGWTFDAGAVSDDHEEIGAKSKRTAVDRGAGCGACAGWRVSAAGGSYRTNALVADACRRANITAKRPTRPGAFPQSSSRWLGLAWSIPTTL